MTVRRPRVTSILAASHLDRRRDRHAGRIQRHRVLHPDLERVVEVELDAGGRHVHDLARLVPANLQLVLLRAETLLRAGRPLRLVRPGRRRIALSSSHEGSVASFADAYGFLARDAASRIAGPMPFFSRTA